LNAIDISMALGADLPMWPSSPGLTVERRLSLDRGDEANVSTLTMDVHTGTHVDAPRHFLPAGRELEQLGLEPFVGVADVVDLSSAATIDAAALRAVVAGDARRLLLRTRNSLTAGFRTGPFRTDYVAISPDGARWLADRELALVGVDYLSVQRFADPPDAHTVLLDAGVALLEGLVLNHVRPGRYLLACLPLRLDGVEAAPARAILLPASEVTQ
jgi:arylformamidase